MAKTWLVEGGNGPYGAAFKSHTTYEAAEIAAKKRASKEQADVSIFEAIAVAKAVVPAIEIEKL